MGQVFVPHKFSQHSSHEATYILQIPCMVLERNKMNQDLAQRQKGRQARLHGKILVALGLAAAA